MLKEIIYGITGSSYTKYIWGELLNGDLEEGDYPDLPNFLDFEEWKQFQGVIYLGILKGKIWGDVIFWGGNFVINHRVKKYLKRKKLLDIDLLM